MEINVHPLVSLLNDGIDFLSIIICWFCSIDSIFLLPKQAERIYQRFLSYVSVLFVRKCYAGISRVSLSILRMKVPPKPSDPNQSITFSLLKLLLKVECELSLRIFLYPLSP